MANTHVTTRVKKHRDALRRSGLRPIQIWVPDTRLPRIVEECQRQSRLAALSDAENKAIQRFMDESLSDVDGWTA